MADTRVARWSKELLKDTPMNTENFNDEREREDLHRSLAPDDQPHMVIIMGILDYGVLWIGPAAGDSSAALNREEQAEKEADWWRDRIREGLEILPFTRNPSPHDIQVRTQASLDHLTEAIQRTYRHD